METLEVIDREVGAVFAPPGVWTPRAVEELAALQEHPFRAQIIDLLRSAEKDIFVPLLTLSTPADFAKQFEFLAMRFAPIRITAALWFVQGIGADFVPKYFEATRELRARLVGTSWGLPEGAFAATFDSYVDTARTLVRLAPNLTLVPGHDLLQVLRPITEVDFGLTSLSLAFEREIRTVDWVVAETFTRTNRAVLEYGQAVSVISGHIDEAARVERVLSELRPGEGVEQPTERDLKSNLRRYSP